MNIQEHINQNLTSIWSNIDFIEKKLLKKKSVILYELINESIATDKEFVKYFTRFPNFLLTLYQTNKFDLNILINNIPDNITLMASLWDNHGFDKNYINSEFDANLKAKIAADNEFNRYNKDNETLDNLIIKWTPYFNNKLTYNQHIKNIFDSNIFNDPECVIKFFELTNNKKHDVLYKSLKNKTSNDLVHSYICSKLNMDDHTFKYYNNAINNIPTSFFNRQPEFIIPYIFYLFHFKQTDKIDNFIGNIELEQFKDSLDYLKKNNINMSFEAFDYFYPKLKKEIQEDLFIINGLSEKSSYFFKSIYKQKENYIHLNLEQPNFYKIKNYVPEMNIDKLIKYNPKHCYLYLNKHIDTLNKPEFEFLKNDINIINGVSCRGFIKFSNQNFLNLYSDPILFNRFIKTNPDLYEKLPLEIQEIPDVALNAILGKSGKSKVFNLIPIELQSDNDFLLKILKGNMTLVNIIPKEAFNDKNFILETLKLIDEGISNSFFSFSQPEDIINNLPQSIRNIIHTFEITKNFYSSLSNYIIEGELRMEISQQPKMSKVKI